MLTGEPTAHSWIYVDEGKLDTTIGGHIAVNFKLPLTFLNNPRVSQTFRSRAIKLLHFLGLGRASFGEQKEPTPIMATSPSRVEAA